MTTTALENINIVSFDHMPAPEELHARLPLTETAGNVVEQSREALRNILTAKTNACSSLSDLARFMIRWRVWITRVV
jgi:3-deoxy-D-arabino-heptulosonate 7-phosphate (DAHP) synthase